MRGGGECRCDHHCAAIVQRIYANSGTLHQVLFQRGFSFRVMFLIPLAACSRLTGLCVPGYVRSSEHLADAVTMLIETHPHMETAVFKCRWSPADTIFLNKALNLRVLNLKLKHQNLPLLMCAKNLQNLTVTFSFTDIADDRKGYPATLSSVLRSLPSLTFLKLRNGLWIPLSDPYPIAEWHLPSLTDLVLCSVGWPLPHFQAPDLRSLAIFGIDGVLVRGSEPGGLQHALRHCLCLQELNLHLTDSHGDGGEMDGIYSVAPSLRRFAQGTATLPIVPLVSSWSKLTHLAVFLPENTPALVVSFVMHQLPCIIHLALRQRMRAAERSDFPTRRGPFVHGNLCELVTDFRDDSFFEDWTCPRLTVVAIPTATANFWSFAVRCPVRVLHIHEIVDAIPATLGTLCSLFIDEIWSEAFKSLAAMVPATVSMLAIAHTSMPQAECLPWMVQLINNWPALRTISLNESTPFLLRLQDATDKRLSRVSIVGTDDDEQMSLFLKFLSW